MNSKSLLPFLPFLFLLGFFHTSTAQSPSDFPSLAEIESAVIESDGKFWTAYNSCDVEEMANFITEDLEFYHDKGGLTETAAEFKRNIKERLCGEGGVRIRRAAVEGTVQVFPLNGYGAILSGEHVFYVNDGEHPEFLDGIAKFTHVWRYADGTWKMARVLSYDHKPAAQEKNEEVVVPADILEAYVGEYQAPQTGHVVIKMKDDVLEIDAGKMLEKIYPKSETVFFMKGNPVSFEFVKGKNGKVEKMVVWEKGSPVEEAQRLD